MKFYSATTTVQLQINRIEDGVRAALPAGSEVTAVAVNDAATTFHLNYRDEEGQTWDGHAGIFDIELGGIVATVNEG